MLEKSLKNLPNEPGIYQFFDEKNHLLYIGKAKDLKKRVRSYFKFTPTLAPNPTLSLRILNMLKQATSLEFLTVASEHDAFILENSLIKQLKPKYNILLRDDKTYPYIYIDFSDKYPRFDITRKVVKGKNIKYFGPFSSGARALLNALYLIFPLAQKRGCQNVKKACIFYQMKRCLAPCEDKISNEEYLNIVNQAVEFIGKPKEITKELKKKMELYAKALEFEEAAKLRDEIRQIEEIESFSSFDSAKLEDFDIFSISIEEKSACALRLFVRAGKVVSSSHSLVKSVYGFDLSELYHQVILNAYKEGSPMLINKIFIADEIDGTNALSLALESKHGKKIVIKNPKRGEKKELCTLAKLNAQRLLKQNKKSGLLEEIYSYFEFKDLPYRVEAFDNSHLGGESPVGAMIVWENDGFDKDSYRKFHLKSKDEYSQMRELLTNRVERFDKSSPPNLWVIDGGVTLLNLAIDILNSMGVNIDVIAISKEKLDAKSKRAKGASRDLLHTKNGTFELPTTDKKLQFFQRLRDESHRFAIEFHRKSRRKNLTSFSTLKTQGVSDGAIKKLIDYFGTFEKMKSASYDEIKTICSKKVADKIFYQK